MTRAGGGPLRIASLAKQVPVAASFRLEEGRLVRRGVDVEMNPYCRRAVAEGVTLARATDGTCTAITLGPPGAEDVLREAIAWGATSGLHVCDPAFVRLRHARHGAGPGRRPACRRALRSRAARPQLH